MSPNHTTNDHPGIDSLARQEASCCRTQCGWGVSAVAGCEGMTDRRGRRHALLRCWAFRAVHNRVWGVRQRWDTQTKVQPGTFHQQPGLHAPGAPGPYKAANPPGASSSPASFEVADMHARLLLPGSSLLCIVAHGTWRGCALHPPPPHTHPHPHLHTHTQGLPAQRGEASMGPSQTSSTQRWITLTDRQDCTNEVSPLTHSTHTDKDWGRTAEHSREPPTTTVGFS